MVETAEISESIDYWKRPRENYQAGVTQHWILLLGSRNCVLDFPLERDDSRQRARCPEVPSVIIHVWISERAAMPWTSSFSCLVRYWYAPGLELRVQYNNKDDSIVLYEDWAVEVWNVKSTNTWCHMSAVPIRSKSLSEHYLPKRITKPGIHR